MGSLRREPSLFLVDGSWISYLGFIEERTDRSRMGGRRLRSSHSDSPARWRISPIERRPVEVRAHRSVVSVP